MQSLRILLADDHPLFRKGIKSIIESSGLATDILEANDGRQVLELAHYNLIDLFILDYRMPEMGGYETAKILLSRSPKAKIVVITAYSETDIISSLLNLGVHAFLSKNANAEEIEMALKKVLNGETYLNKTLKDRIQREVVFSKRTISPLKFTSRENDLVLLLSKGKTSKEISNNWGLSLKTVETYRCRLLEKVGVKNSTELLQYFNNNGLI